jgi:hypothetical protein
MALDRQGSSEVGGVSGLPRPCKGIKLIAKWLYRYEKGNTMEQNVWKSAISTEMVEGWSENDVEALINALDDAVMQVFQSVKEERA